MMKRLRLRRPRHSRTVVGLAVAACAALVVSACGTGGGPSGDASGAGVASVVTTTETVTVTAGADDATDDGTANESGDASKHSVDSGADAPTGPTITEPGGDAAPGGIPTLNTSLAAPDILTGGTVASVDANGIMAVSLPAATDAIELDIYEDPLCPFCSKFETSFGAKIVQALNGGHITIRYRLVNFLDRQSASGDYSTRAIAAMLTLAAQDGDTPDAVLAFHRALFDPSIQPHEGTPTDLSNEQLADVARQVGASPATVTMIAAGSDLTDATATATANLGALQAIAAKVGRKAGTPSVVHDDALLDVHAGWLDELLGS